MVLIFFHDFQTILVCIWSDRPFLWWALRRNQAWVCKLVKRILDFVLAVSMCMCNSITIVILGPVFSSHSSVRQDLCVPRRDLWNDSLQLLCAGSAEPGLGREVDFVVVNSPASWKEEKAQELRNDDSWPDPFQSWTSYFSLFKRDICKALCQMKFFYILR